MNSAIRVWDYTWWIWFLNASCIVAGLLVDARWFLVAIGVSLLQALFFVVRERSIRSFASQLRIAFLLMLVVFYYPPLRVLYWIPAIGTFAMLLIGYCLLARLLSLLPWNHTEPLTFRSFFRTFFSAPRLDAAIDGAPASSCPGGVCTLEVQVGRPTPKAR